MQLNLSKPLVFFDLETTGVNVGKDHIVEICLHKVNPDHTTETHTYRIRPVDAEGRTVHIPEATTAIHGISDQDVADKPSFRELSQELLDFIGDADLAGYNSNKFDVPLLVEEFLRIGVEFNMEGRHFVDVQNIFHQMEQRTLKAAYRFYCDKDLENAHSADADTLATAEVLMAQLDRYAGVDYKDPRTGRVTQPVVNDVAALARFTRVRPTADLAGFLGFDDKQRPVFNFGKYKGKTVEEVFEAEPSYYDWISKSEFPISTKRVAEEIYRRVRQRRKLSQLKAHFGN